ncbi:MAG: sigma-70 family RNA polymerase sigma factor [Planctomycetota bacterium]
MGNIQGLQSDNALLAAIRLGDRTAFEALVRKYQNLVTSVAYSGVGDFAQSEDLAQQTFLIAWEKQDEISDGNRIAGWLCGVVRNLARNTRRKRANIRHAEGVQLDEVTEPRSSLESPETIAIDREEQNLLWSVLERLPDNYREPLILFYRENQSVESVACQLGISESAVKQRLSRGRAMVKEDLHIFVENALSQTQPTASFSIAVMAALPIISATAGSVIGKGTAGAASTWTIKNLLGGSTMSGLFGWVLSGAFLGTMGGLFGAFAGILGAWFGVRQAVNQATSKQEKKLVVRGGILSGVMGFGFVVAMLIIMFSPAIENKLIALIILSLVYTTAIMVFSLKFHKAQLLVKKEFGNEQEKAGKLSLANPTLSPQAVRTTAISSSVGMWIWYLCLQGISGAWGDVAGCSIFLVIFSVYLGLTAPESRVQQSKYIKNAILISGVGLVIAVYVGWGRLFFADRLPSYFGVMIPAVILVFLGLIGGGIHYANRTREQLTLDAVLEDRND